MKENPDNGQKPESSSPPIWLFLSTTLEGLGWFKKIDSKMYKRSNICSFLTYLYFSIVSWNIFYDENNFTFRSGANYTLIIKILLFPSILNHSDFLTFWLISQSIFISFLSVKIFKTNQQTTLNSKELVSNQN